MADIPDYQAEIREQVQNSRASKERPLPKAIERAASEDEIGALIETLMKGDSSAQELRAALSELHVISNFSKIIPARSAELKNALRGLVRAQDVEVRKQALAYLTLTGDDVAEQYLREELQSGLPEAERMVPTHQAIAMLSTHRKAIDTELLLTIAQDPPDEESLIQAIRHLPANTETAEVLSNILKDDSKPIAARALVPELISKADPVNFAEIAKTMLKAEGAESEIAPYLARGVASIQPDLDEEAIEEIKAIVLSIAESGDAKFEQAARAISNSKIQE